MKDGHILAEVTLNSNADALRSGTGPITSFPTILDLGGDAFSSQALIENQSMVRPGAVIRVPFRFLAPESALSGLFVGSEFSIWEYKQVGTGRVLEVLAGE